MEWVLLVVVLIIVISALVIRSKGQAAEAAAKQAAEASVAREARFAEVLAQYGDALARQRLALVRTDAYGVEDKRAWGKDLEHFINNVMLARFGDDLAHVPDLGARLDRFAAERGQRLLMESQFRADMSPLEYEAFCAEQLRRHGWTADTTKGSGDQGADVIATRNGVRAVLQCKLYSKPVGNGAVQEVSAARSHYGAAVAAVVTNAGFTPAAQSLAATTGVLLLSHFDLPRLRELPPYLATNVG